MSIFNTPKIRTLISLALDEDGTRGDLTSETLIPETDVCEAEIIAKQGGVFCGGPLAGLIFSEMRSPVRVELLTQEGERVQPKKVIAKFYGSTRDILRAERVILNFWGRLSGISTLTSTYVDCVQDTQTKILDTRKTTPVFRELEKYAVRMGGGTNHRMGLDDAILIKENHLERCGGVKKALETAKSHIGPHRKIEVEVKDLEELKVVLLEGCDIVMLDNFSTSKIEEAIALREKMNSSVLVEVSGGITLNRLPELSQVGVDYISVGALTHSASCFDFSLLIN